MNYFELLGLSPAFSLGLQSLEQAYFAQQRLFHPDRFVRKSAEERQQALLRSVEINAAYETLKKPLSRAQYLLHLQGTQVGTEADTLKPSAQLLMDTMEWREAIDEATHADELKTLNESLTIMHSKITDAIAFFYDSRNWPAMAQETLRLAYIIKAQEAIRLHKANA